MKLPKLNAQTLKDISKAGEKHLKRYIRNHKNGATLVAAGFGFAATIALTAIGTVRAVRAVDVAEEEKGEPLTTKEMVKTAGKCYIPAAVSAAASYAGLYFAGKGYEDQVAAVTAHAISEATAYNELRKELKDTIGEEKLEEAENNIAAKHASDYAANTRCGVFRCHDEWSGAEFFANENDINAAVNWVNNELNGGTPVGYDEWLYEIDPDIDGGKKCEEFGFESGKTGHMKVKITPVVKENGEIVLWITQKVRPRGDFNR